MIKWILDRTVGWMFIAGLLAVGSLIAQVPTPAVPLTYNCVSTDPLSPTIQFRFSPLPLPTFSAVIGVVPSTDTEIPVINKITNSANNDITTGTAKFVTSTNGLALTVTATDNIGVVAGILEIDGKLATPFGNGVDKLPNPFYVRWNTIGTSITPGQHNMKLTAYDAAHNAATKSWTMIR